MTVAGTLIALAALPAASTSATSRGICPAYCGRRGGPELIGLRQLGGGRASFSVLLVGGGRYELEFTRVVGGHVVRVRATVINDHPQLTLTGRVPTGGRSETVAVIQLRSQRAGVRSTTVELNGRRRRLVPGTYVVTVNALTRGGALWLRGSSIAASVKAGGRIAHLLEPRLAPDASTEAASAIAQTVATLSGNLDPYGQSSSYYFQYGTTTAYGAQTLSQAAGAGRKPVRVSANVIGLSLATTYHYRLVASACSGCRWGTSYGADHTFTTTAATGLSEQQIDADRAVSAYNAMQASFYAADGSSLYAENSPSSGNPYSYLWPFSRALVGTATLAGVPPNLLGGASYQAAAQDRLTGLSRYWSGTGYESYPPAPYGKGGDKYYDDAAWVGLATAQYYAMSGNTIALADAENAFGFVYPGGWDSNPTSPDPGGIYFVNQGLGVGVSNHDRTTTSNAPNAELAALLGTFDPANASTYDADAALIYGWVNQYLYNVPTSPNYSSSRPALMFDHVTGSGTIDHTLWTYNQGTMIAANVREYQLTGQATYLSNAEAIASTAMSTFTESTYLAQPAAFDAIFFRGLLVLYAVTSDGSLQSRIIQTIQTYADDAWSNYRSSGGLFRFLSSSGTGYQLLDQGAMVQIYAMLAWSPSDYGKLP